jgi:hypothetical protein
MYKFVSHKNIPNNMDILGFDNKDYPNPCTGNDSHKEKVTSPIKSGKLNI